MKARLSSMSSQYKEFCFHLHIQSQTPIFSALHGVFACVCFVEAPDNLGSLERGGSVCEEQMDSLC